MYYIIQENTFREEGHTRLLECLDRLNLGYEVIKVLPLTDEIKFKTDRKDVFVFGALKLARIYKQYGWKPGCLMTPNHNFMVYRNHYREGLLNFDSKVFQFGEDFGWPGGRYFIRPCDDSKVFHAGIFNMISWNKFRHDMLTSGHSDNLTEETLMQVASTKEIQKEFRFWVVDGRIVTASIYKMYNRPIFNGIVDDGATEFCQEMVNKFQLAKAFVIDICLTNNKWKIVECGCINCAGFYSADMQKLIVALEDTYKKDLAR